MVEQYIIHLPVAIIITPRSIHTLAPGQFYNWLVEMYVLGNVIETTYRYR